MLPTYLAVDEPRWTLDDVEDMREFLAQVDQQNSPDIFSHELFDVFWRHQRLRDSMRCDIPSFVASVRAHALGWYLHNSASVAA